MGFHRQKTEAGVRQGDPHEMGECWLYVALAATQKTVIRSENAMMRIWKRF
jgi:hypothetical protein